MMEMTRRGFIKSLAAIGMAAYLPTEFILNSVNRNFEEIYFYKLKPIQRFQDSKLSKLGYTNLLFKGVPVTDKYVDGSIWDDNYYKDAFGLTPKERKEKIYRIRNEFLTFIRTT